MRMVKAWQIGMVEIHLFQVLREPANWRNKEQRN